MVYSELLQMTGRITTELPWIAVAKYFDKVDSTQKRIEQFLPKEGEGAVLVLAETQSKAVGRQGREWHSPAGGVWFTLALPLKNLTLAQVAPFSMVTALTLADSLREVNNLDCELKWPNDIFYKGKKVAGILLSTTTKYKRAWLLIGIGINVNNELPAELKTIATSIKAIRGQSQGRSRLIESVLAALWTAWQEFDRTGFGPYQKAFENKLKGIGEIAKILMGNKTIQGTLLGIDPQGGLLLKSGPGTKTVHAGEIVG
jgi:BirA family transcriptional regulator, biotin operon repressor / biotin---[acetyl-CoA-carboxylase] ligase